jgi:hypothetical protein
MRHLNEYDNKMKSYTELGGLDTYATINNIRYWNVFTYYKPLCYQTYPNTDSRLESSSSASLMLISRLGIDKEPEPGTSILYFISKILFPLLLILLFYIVKFIISYVKSFKSISKSIKYFHTIKNK